LRVANEIDGVSIQKLKNLWLIYDEAALTDICKNDRRFNDLIKKIFGILEHEIKNMPKDFDGVNKEKMKILGKKLMKNRIAQG